jgi:hypothetical protein
MPIGRSKPEVTSGPVYECEAATGWKSRHTPILPVDDFEMCAHLDLPAAGGASSTPALDTNFAILSRTVASLLAAKIS